MVFSKFLPHSEKTTTATIVGEWTEEKKTSSTIYGQQQLTGFSSLAFLLVIVVVVAVIAIIVVAACSYESGRIAVNVANDVGWFAVGLNACLTVWYELNIVYLNGL